MAITRRISDRVGEAQALRGALVTELQGLLDRAEAEGRGLTDIEQVAFDKLKNEIAQGDRHLENVRSLENISARAAVRVGPSREPPPLEKGVAAARLVQLLIASKGVDQQAHALAQRHFSDMPQLASVFEARAVGALQRAAMAPANTTDPQWASALVYANQLGSELIELVRPETVLGQLQGMRTVPFNVRIPREVAAVASARWVGQGQSKPVGKGAFDYITVPFTKVALITLFTEELARFSDPSAETLLRDSLVRSLAQFLDEQFLSTNAAVLNVSPGGILAGLPAAQSFVSSGFRWDQILWDAVQAVNLLTTGLLSPRRPTWIMSPANKAAISFLPNSFGLPALPSVEGQGTLAGYPIIVSQNIPSTIVLLVDADMLLFASDPNIRLDVSREASVQADTDPSSPPTGMVSLWQQNLIGILCEQYAWWGRARDTAIVQITGVAWATAPAPVSAPVDPIAAATAARAAGAPRRT